MPTDLTNNKLFAALAAVILATVLGIVGYYITRPYVQYEEGQVYKSGNVAVASLRLENKGYFDAEQVLIEGNFPESITEITSGDALSPMIVTSGGKGFKSVIGSIPRINPSQAVYVYFTVDNSGGSLGQSMPGFVKQVTFRNGQGSTNAPGWQTLGLGFITGSLSGMLIAGVGALVWRTRMQATEIKAAQKAIGEITEGIQANTDKLLGIAKKVDDINNKAQ